MKKLSLLALGGLCFLTLAGCGSSPETENQTPNETENQQVAVQTDVCKKYLDLVECTLATQEEDQQAYMDTLRADVAAYPADQQQAICSEQWNLLLERSDTYAALGCPME